MSGVTEHNYGATAHFTMVPQHILLWCHSTFYYGATAHFTMMPHHTIMVPLHSECIFISVRTPNLKPQHTRGQNTKSSTDIYAASFPDALTPVQTVA
jgi:hypothetical protein